MLRDRYADKAKLFPSFGHVQVEQNDEETWVSVTFQIGMSHQP